MVKILLIVPYADVQKQFEQAVSHVDEKDIEIETIHIYGTPLELLRQCHADIVIVRGLTGVAFKQVSDKQVVNITMTSFDIMDAIAHCKREFSPKKVALILHDNANVDVKSISELSGIDISLYNISDEDEIPGFIQDGLSEGCEVFIGGLTLCQKCDALGLPRIHIKTSQASIERAIAEALNAARTLNQERTKTNLVQAVLNNATEAIIYVGNQGQIMEVNSQARMLYRIPMGDNIIGKNVDSVFPSIDWRESLAEGVEHEKLQHYFDKLYYVRCRPIIVDQQGAGVLITTQSAAEITETETKIRKGLTEKGLVAKYTFENIIGESPAMRHNINIAHKYALVDSNVLIVGETGTGKELFAHSIHSASRRCDQPFVAVNCAALPENLLESELFGYVEGAFSGASKGGKAGLFELAHKGTIFLDEIGEIPISLQAKLLRVLQEKEIRRIGADKVIPVDARVISATNIDLARQIARGTFRADLYYRLNLLNIQIPPLRERREDIPAMVEYFLQRYAIQTRRAPPVLTQGALHKLCGYELLGNSRELRNICERFVVLNESGSITAADVERLVLPLTIPPASSRFSHPDTAVMEQRSKKQTREEVARSMGISRTTLWRRMKQELKQNNETSETN